MMKIPSNPGTVVRHKVLDRLYVRDETYWRRNGTYWTDEQFQKAIDTRPDCYEIVNEGYVAPMEEPKGFGTLVMFGSGHFAVRSNVNTDFPWVIKYSWGSYDVAVWKGIISDGPVEIIQGGIE